MHAYSLMNLGAVCECEVCELPDEFGCRQQIYLCVIYFSVCDPIMGDNGEMVSTNGTQIHQGVCMDD